MAKQRTLICRAISVFPLFPLTRDYLHEANHENIEVSPQPIHFHHKLILASPISISLNHHGAADRAPTLIPLNAGNARSQSPITLSRLIPQHQHLTVVVEQTPSVSPTGRI